MDNSCGHYNTSLFLVIICPVIQTGEFKRLSDEIDAIKEQIKFEREKLTGHSISTDSAKNILDEIDRTEFRLTEYDDSLTRRFIERIDVIDKHTIRITFIGGVQAEQVVE